MGLNEITHEILDSSYKVHSALGPGLPESAYKASLAYELRKKGLKVKEEKPSNKKLHSVYAVLFTVDHSVVL